MAIDPVNMSQSPAEQLVELSGFPLCTWTSKLCSAKSMFLPPHRQYDMAIDILPGTLSPRGHLYSLTLPKMKDINKYIEGLLAAGIIRPSSSTAGAGFFFCGKKRQHCDPALITVG